MCLYVLFLIAKDRAIPAYCVLIFSTVFVTLIIMIGNEIVWFE